MVERSSVLTRRRSPLSRLTDEISAGSGDNVALREIPFLAQIGLRAAPGSASASALESALGGPLPGGAGEVAQVGDGLAEHDASRGLGQRGGGRLGDEGHRARRARVGLEDVEHVGGQRVLDVEQTVHSHTLCDEQGGVTDPFDHLVAQGDGRK